MQPRRTGRTEDIDEDGCAHCGEELSGRVHTIVCPACETSFCTACREGDECPVCGEDLGA